MNNNNKTKSPLKNPPLRQPGQSLIEEKDKLFDDKFIPYVMAAVMSFAFAGMEWMRYFDKLPPQPVALTILAIVILLIVVKKSVKIISHAKMLNLAIKGEQVVGQTLEQDLRPMGYQIFHDIIAESGEQKFNIDHVAIGPNGIFTIETKTRSKPSKGSTEVKYDGKYIRLNDGLPDNKPIIQAKAQASWLYNYLKEFTGKGFKIKPIVVYPGWYISEASTNYEVWVLNADRVYKNVSKNSVKLSNEDMAMVSSHIRRFITA